MMIFKLINILCMICYTTAYSQVHESVKHGLYMEDYCPTTEHCREGTHVACMYNPEVGNGIGAGCHLSVNVTISSTLASKVLNVVNEIRKSVLTGNETGIDGKPLPTGYGVWRFEWDEELATFAQILANQCVMKHDLCRATKRFSDPGQSVGQMRFTYPNWNTLKPQDQEEFGNGFSLSMIDIAILKIIKKWYQQKKYVTAESIKKYQNTSKGSLYLFMVYGAATHIGCGVSAYIDYVYNLNNADMLYNVIQLVCNFSERPQPGKPIYETDPPPKNNHTISGCPIDIAEEDDNGLCYAKPSKNESDSDCGKYPGMCKKELPIVILPIFSIGNHPIDGSLNNFTNSRRHSQRRVEVRNVRSYSDSSLDPHKIPKPVDAHGAELYRKRSNVPIARYSRLNNAKIKYVDDIGMVRLADGRHFEGWVAPNSRKTSLNIVIEDNDTKLWTLLNKFEFEMKHTKLRPEEREILNEKIRKIYESLIKTKRNFKNDELQTTERKKALPEKELIIALQQRPTLKNLAYSRQNLRRNELRREHLGNRLNKLNKEPAKISHEENYQINRPVLTPESVAGSQWKDREQFTPEQ